MKYLNIILLALLVSGCCSTKKVAQTEQEKIVQAETTQTSEAPVLNTDIPDVPTPKEDMADVDVEEEIQLEKPTTEDNSTIEAFNHNTYNMLLKANVSEAGNVDYKAFKSNPKPLRDYIKSLGENMPKDDWTKNDKLAYWINAYNAMTIDLIIRNYPIKSIKDIDKPWEQRLWKLGN